MRAFARRFLIAPFLAGCFLIGSAASALTLNPMSGSLPLSDHAGAYCPTMTDFVGGGDFASCALSRSAEDPVTLTYVLGSGEATSDLRQGTLRSRSTGQGYLFNQTRLSADGFSTAGLYDTITFVGSGIVELRMTVQGSMVMTDPTGYAVNRATGNLNTLTDSGDVISQLWVRVDQEGQNGVPLLYPDPAAVTGLGVITTNANSSGVFDPNDVRFELSTFVEVSPSSPTFSFFARLGTNAGFRPSRDFDHLFQSDVDFGNTAQLELIVPQGVSWTSASGVFLAPVPAPATLALLATALGALCPRVRPRRDRGLS